LNSLRHCQKQGLNDENALQKSHAEISRVKDRFSHVFCFFVFAFFENKKNENKI